MFYVNVRSFLPSRTPNFMWYNLPTISYSYHTTSPKLPLAWLSDFASDQNGPPSTLALITDQASLFPAQMCLQPILRHQCHLSRLSVLN